MKNNETHVVTGAFGYTGRYIARELLRRGIKVRTLTNKEPVDDPFDGAVDAWPLVFGSPELLADSMRGATTLYNTYWVRFNHGNFSHSEAVENTKTLLDAAKAAGIKRIVHVSITNPSEDSPFEYFRGKAVLEKYLAGLGVSYAIIRPAVIFGVEDILINNIAWMLRRFPVFGVFGDGAYGIQPIFVEDMAGLAVDAGLRDDNTVLDAVGPESFTYRGLVEAIGDAIGCPRPLVNIPPSVGYAMGRALGVVTGDIVITKEEIGGLMAGLLAVDTKPLGKTKLTEWARGHRDTLGKTYASELSRRR
ncbi:MAG: NAD(P)H-binding protein [Nitrospirae bacterium]|nr:NAD(P)H-binding protein [Nitrospirota bacterium]